MVITERQMHAFRMAATEGFVTRLHQHLDSIDPGNKFEPDAAHQLITNGIKRAQDFGLLSEVDVARFVVVLFTLGENFDRDINLPWVSAILNYRHFGSPSARIRAIYEAARQSTPPHAVVKK